MLILCGYTNLFLHPQKDILPLKHSNNCMSRYRKILTKVFASLLFIALVSSSKISFAADGEALFKANCANCHKPLEDYTGPKLQGARSREPNPTWAYKWVNNVNTMVETDPYAKGLLAKYGAKMTQFNLKEEEIKAILDYADNYKAPAAPTAGTAGAPAEDNSLLFGILTLVLAVIALILLQVNSSLRKLSDEKDGIIRTEPVPFYRNKTYIMMGVLVLFCLGGYITINAAIGLGRMKNYQPEQPIYYSHKVHAGTNQISCLYCHGGSQDSKHANIPSVNVCMNCHMAIKEYKGDPIVREDGKSVNGTAEIQKLYQYAGWNPDAKKYDKPGKAIEWIKIHNLPDHVYFNHSQHVKVGKQQCQTCHGPIQEMPEVYQFADLSMGWCINCHRESKVNFYNKESGEGNKFYSIYEKFHKDIKEGKLDSVTVEKIGGTECQKCHY
ncbi:MAG: quinol:cytochrome c oxidoreductase pentaheme cytochrome subunit [Ferruginibacter sp.]|nr:quinol:cytochrome c oxidoreductase pentaheme cytochrome subunit [Ferruginibacter sp.]